MRTNHPVASPPETAVQGPGVSLKTKPEEIEEATTTSLESTAKDARPVPPTTVASAELERVAEIEKQQKELDQREASEKRFYENKQKNQRKVAAAKERQQRETEARGLREAEKDLKQKQEKARGDELTAHKKEIARKAKEKRDDEMRKNREKQIASNKARTEASVRQFNDHLTASQHIEKENFAAAEVEKARKSAKDAENKLAQEHQTATQTHLATQQSEAQTRRMEEKLQSEAYTKRMDEEARLSLKTKQLELETAEVLLKNTQASSHWTPFTVDERTPIIDTATARELRQEPHYGAPNSHLANWP